MQGERNSGLAERKQLCLQDLPGLNLMPMGCWHSEGAILDANDSLLRLIGYSSQEAQEGKVRWKELTPPRFLPRDQRALQEIRDTGTCAPFDKEYIRKDGRHVPVLIVGAAFQIDRPDSGPFIVLDLTEWKRKEIVNQLRIKLLPSIHNNVTTDIVAEEAQRRVELVTQREREVMYLLAAGESTKEIAHCLSISPKTVDAHRAKILAKMNVDNPTQLARLLSLLDD